MACIRQFSDRRLWRQHARNTKHNLEWRKKTVIISAIFVLFSLLFILAISSLHLKGLNLLCISGRQNRSSLDISGELKKEKLFMETVRFAFFAFGFLLILLLFLSVSLSLVFFIQRGKLFHINMPLIRIFVWSQCDRLPIHLSQLLCACMEVA